MDLGNSSALQKELIDWCNDALIHTDHALLVLDVPTSVGVAFIEETLETVKVFGRVCVRSTKEGPSVNSLLVLCECREKIVPDRVPSVVMTKDWEHKWKIVIVRNPEPVTVDLITNPEPVTDFTMKLNKLLQDADYNGRC